MWAKKAADFFICGLFLFKREEKIKYSGYSIQYSGEKITCFILTPDF
jgi:hypothetical protein